MAPRSTNTKEAPRWRITQMRGNAAKQLGFVNAPDEASARKRAIEQYGVRPELQSRVVARPAD